MARLNARAWLGGAAAAALGLSGCAGTYDVLTSQRFKERPFHTLFSSDDPVHVLETVQEGDDRVRAMRNLKEPREHGGTPAEQDKVIAILQASAISDSRSLCRLAAVETLSRFKDPRAGQILIAAYRNAPHGTPPAEGQPNQVTPAAVNGLGIKAAVSSFTPDTVTTIQCRSLEALGRHRTPEGLQVLVEVATTPPKRPSASEPDWVDVRLAAIRALGNYQGHTTAARALVTVLQTEKHDVAVRGRTHEALQNVTGQDLPPTPEAWTAWLEKGGKMR